MSGFRLTKGDQSIDLDDEELPHVAVMLAHAYQGDDAGTAHFAASEWQGVAYTIEDGEVAS